MRRIAALASAGDEQTTKEAVGIFALAISSLAKALSLSIAAALRVGPTILSPLREKASTIPKARYTSGPTTVRSIPSAWAQSAMASIPPAGSGAHRAT